MALLVEGGGYVLTTIKNRSKILSLLWFHNLIHTWTNYAPSLLQLVKVYSSKIGEKKNSSDQAEAT